MRFLHCSDVHVTLNYFKLPVLKLGWRRWIAMAELQMGGRARTYLRAKETLARIAADGMAAEVDHVVLSGDLTAYSLEQEFRGAREALGALAEDPRRFTVIPGNHDRYTPGALRSKRFEKHFGHLLKSDLPQYAVEDGFPFVRLLGPKDAVVGLCSARVPTVPGMSFGDIRERQFQALAALLNDPAMQGRAVLVAVHHAPFKENGKPDKPMHGLREAERLLRMLAGPRFAVLHGHIHHRYYHPPSASQPHIFGAGSSTEKDHEGYWLIQTRDGQVVGGEKRELQPAQAA